MDALAAADDFAIAFGGEHVKGESEVGALGVGLHVEGFDGRGIVVDHDRAVVLVGDDGLLVAAEVVAELGGIAGFLQNGNSIFVGDAREGRLDVFELRDVALEGFEFAGFVFDDALYDGGDEAFAKIHHVGKFGVSGFGLKHPEFGEVAASLGFFGAEGGAEGVDLAEGHGGGFDVELSALREVGLLVVDVIHFKERAGAFASGGGEHGSVGKGVALRVHEFAGGADGFGTDAEDGGLARRANPEMALVEEEIDAMLFELDGERRGFGDSLDDLDFADADFVAAGGALLGVDFAGDDDAGFLGEAFEGLEGFGIFFQGADALNDAGAVAKDGEEEFAGFAEIVEPAADGDFLGVVLACEFDGDYGHGEVLCCEFKRTV